MKPAFIQLQELASKLEDYNKKYIIAISEYIRMALSNKNNGISTENLSYVIGQVLNSTYFSYSKIIDFDYDRNSFSRVDRIIFSRIISNLINNSIEANKNKIDFRIKIITKVSFGNVYVLIKDNGVGIPRENIEKIFEKGYSLNGSSGTGLFFCREEVRKYGGDIFCYSDAKKTEFKIKLPLCNSAYNYIASIYINNKSKIIIVDDEYPEYFKNIEGKIPYNYYLKDELSVAEYFKLSNIDRSNDIYLIDYNFSRDFSGLDIIKKYNLIGQAYIITTIADNIRQSISEEYKEQIPVLDKSMANFIQVKNVRLFDYFVLEDDMLICKIMNDKAKLNKQRILIVNNFLQFNMLKKVISKDNHLVLDISIEGSRLRGEQYIKELKEQGFLNISVQSGYSNLNLGDDINIIEKGSF
ncbi:ATP-binding protein [Francisella philomiragia]|uniref:histidine kinase n=1 Tax=Francisella philomiragia subsp. philomiragia (strain ATCC 25017 / CCUG 19701 / FSC 153 / O\|nr:ATP-binding protein [Francisella philomiragia]AJI48086.1 histidine kinase-, DNA gyrase B-, and HSP90-like ATPase family protein [Francisella philomiragia]AJI48281.1 histidine kinase-, DNA gyrase B-, and HSP90-like ATPase family protein [Francisella philomiragia]MBK2020518.1 ATP-binding protein [Francisella philomiragia]MBK2030211.1 ATP-binding protein [Francisella philomiragia]MBK2264827.1 ATP-binding protein [Francisella philomiragia]